MKIIISYPPFKTNKGTPTLGQNRQFQYFKEPTYIYPVVPAIAATLLKQNGFEVIWNDCISEGMNENEYLEFIGKENPDLIAFETKTPVVKQHWAIIDKLKTQNPKLKTVLFGDHVTALPEESFKASNVDFALTGGDYDFLLLNLCNALNAKGYTLHKDGGQALNAEQLEPGIWYRENGQIRNTGQFKLNHDLNSLPFIDRDLTRWRLYAYKNGNFKKTPGTYIMSGRDCWWHKCSFCSWPTLYPEFRARNVTNVLDELGILMDRYGIKEVMDDTGTFPVGDWLREFCNGMVERGYNKKIYLDCNMRFGALSFEDYKMMKKAGFRLLLFGLESASQQTLDRIHKNVKVQEIISSCRLARQAGLFPHITIMFGYPWETYEEARQTLKLGKWLLRRGFAYTMQATMVIPYPGSSLFEECRQNNWLKTLDWDSYDMKQPVMLNPMQNGEIMDFVQGMYKISFHPGFVLRRLLSIRDVDDFKYSFRAARKVIGHLFDFGNQPHKFS